MTPSVVWIALKNAGSSVPATLSTDAIDDAGKKRHSVDAGQFA